MANPLDALNENFNYNSMLSTALLQLLPDKDRRIIQLWLQKLHEMDGDVEAMRIRNEFMWFLLLQLQNKRIVQPFKRPPPVGQLKPLKDILPAEIYEEVLTTSDQNMSWMNQLNTSKDNFEDDKKDAPRMLPALFLDSQPTPKNGVICYMATFSDQDY